MKKLLLAVLMMTGAFSAFSSVHIHYDNKDQKGHTMFLVIDGTEKQVKFDMTRAELTILGGNNVCVIETRCGKIQVSNGDYIVIQDGCIKVMR